jgi:hypothetical protein
MTNVRTSDTSLVFAGRSVSFRSLRISAATERQGLSEPETDPNQFIVELWNFANSAGNVRLCFIFRHDMRSMTYYSHQGQRANSHRRSDDPPINTNPLYRGYRGIEYVPAQQKTMNVERQLPRICNMHVWKGAEIPIDTRTLMSAGVVPSHLAKDVRRGDGLIGVFVCTITGDPV